MQRCYAPSTEFLTEAKKLLKKLAVDFKIFHYSGPREVLRL